MIADEEDNAGVDHDAGIFSGSAPADRSAANTDANNGNASVLIGIDIDYAAMAEIAPGNNSGEVELQCRLRF
jgi:hypothetical protein